MFYYLGLAFKTQISALNVLTYITVRAGGAALTAFLISLIIGPRIISLLHTLKFGQHIRKDHVADLHALHNHKTGTPTMGGVLILAATLIALALWSDLGNRLLITAVIMFAGLSLVGFVDDFISLKKKQNLGLSAKAKFTGQIIVGLLFGLYLYFNPVTSDSPLLDQEDVLSWQKMPAALDEIGTGYPDTQELLLQLNPSDLSTNKVEQARTIAALNLLITRFDFSGTTEKQDPAHRAQANRDFVANTFPEVFAASISNLHTKVEIPGMKNVFIPMGLAYVLFVMIVIVGSSNAVNLTDGLDGLAVGASIISLLAYTGIAYAVSRADWSSYLYLIYVPEASELVVFAAALMGAGLGFLWFNSHPAEVFMGDTGSLAMGGAIGTMAIMTKQELLLLMVGGLFVVEAVSVIVQVASFKLTGKRVFRMAPLHHHFELKGWSESKVTIRFWIIALIFALMSLGALKLR